MLFGLFCDRTFSGGNVVTLMSFMVSAGVSANHGPSTLVAAMLTWQEEGRGTRLPVGHLAKEVVPVTQRTKAIVLGAGLVLVGLVLVYNFGLSSLLHSPQIREYNLTDPLTIEVSSRAVVTDDVELLRWSTMPEFVSPDDIRVEGVAAGSDALFMGIAPADAATGYLDGVAHDEITDWESRADDITDVAYTSNGGTKDPAAPGTEGFWVASVSGSGEQALDWTIESGEWALVIMNADGSPGVSADVRFGVATPSILFPIGLASLVVGLVMAIWGGRLITSLPDRPDETPRWTLGGHSVLPTTVEGRVALFCAVLALFPFTSGTMFGAPIFLFLAVRKGDRSLFLVLPLLVSILPIGLIAILAWNIVGG